MTLFVYYPTSAGDKVINDILSTEIQPGQVKNILITHYDIDHMGYAAKNGSYQRKIMGVKGRNTRRHQWFATTLETNKKSVPASELSRFRRNA
jgi:hypothetical protein